MGDIAPNPSFPEKGVNVYERKMGPNVAGLRGPLRFEEGVATDTDVPDSFSNGMADGWVGVPGRPNHNRPVWDQPAEVTMKERAHVGSAAWVEAPTFLSEFAQGSFTDYGDYRYEEVVRNGARQSRMNPAVVED